MDANTGRMVWGRNEHTRKEIASLTKIMTCYVSLMIVEKLEIDMSMTYV
jgi:D-alanyl-D-alanine carboxypeptidase